MECYAPNLSFLRVWGCLAEVPLPDCKQEAIGSKTFDSVFIDYAQSSSAYRFMSLKDSSTSESRDAEFFEHVFPLKRSFSTTVHETIPMHDTCLCLFLVMVC